MELPVPDTVGCPKNLSVMQQVAWAELARHPRQAFELPVSDHLREAINFECSHSASEIDAFRANLVKKWVSKALELEGGRHDFLVQHGYGSCVLRARLHYPFILWLLGSLDYEDEALANDILGFSVVGKLPSCLVESDPIPGKQRVAPLSYLHEVRQDSNLHILHSLRESEYSADLWEIHSKDVELGAMGKAEVLRQESLSDVTLSRRIAVRELREAGWRTRAVDDMSESFANECTEQSDKQVNGSILQLVWMILMFLQCSVQPTMWKRDIKSALRRLPVAHSHLQYA